MSAQGQGPLTPAPPGMADLASDLGKKENLNSFSEKTEAYTIMPLEIENEY